MLSKKWMGRYMRLAREVSTWSVDPSSQVGACIVRPDKTEAGHGFNGFPRGIRDLDIRLLDRELKNQMIVHAEINAILFSRECLSNYTIITYPFQPCSRCAGAIIQCGIKTVIAPSFLNERMKESFDLAKIMFHEAGVDVVTFDGI